jgi:hypothetical protein
MRSYHNLDTHLKLLKQNYCICEHATVVHNPDNLITEDERQTGRQTELEMLSDELDRTRARVLVLEREREKYADSLEIRTTQSTVYFHSLDAI